LNIHFSTTVTSQQPPVRLNVQDCTGSCAFQPGRTSCGIMHTLSHTVIHIQHGLLSTVSNTPPYSGGDPFRYSTTPKYALLVSVQHFLLPTASSYLLYSRGHRLRYPDPNVPSAISLIQFIFLPTVSISPLRYPTPSPEPRALPSRAHLLLRLVPQLDHI
jgi:hypothetical protein